jgi:uncharacterized membrane protein YbaN (DUF454 family)
MPERLKKISGYGFLFLGVVGAIIPVLPSIPFFMAGASLLGKEHPVIRPFATRIERWRQRRGKTYEAVTEQPLLNQAAD